MANEIGERGDIVRLVLGDEEVKAYGSYQVTSSVFQQPAAFTMKFGWSDVMRNLLKRYPPNTEFSLFIGERRIGGGWIDDPHAKGGQSGSELNISGRDIMSRVYDSFVDAEQSFANKTYLDLLREVLNKVGLADRDILPTNEANRKAISGGRTTGVKENFTTFVTVEEDVFTYTKNKKTVYNSIKATRGQRWFDFLQTELKKVGLFMWADSLGGFVIARPNGDQQPLYRIVRFRGDSRDVSGIKEYDFHNNIAHRYTKAVVYGRAGGRKFGRKKLRGEYVDAEMSALLGGDDGKQIVYHEPDVDSVKAAEFVARWQIAEANRTSWTLSYTVAGHTTVGMNGEFPVVWTPDTVVEVDDDEIGIQGRFYISEVTFNRGPQTTTDLTLMRPQDLVFGEDAKKATAA